MAQTAPAGLQQFSLGVALNQKGPSHSKFHPPSLWQPAVNDQVMLGYKTGPIAPN